MIMKQLSYILSRVLLQALANCAENSASRYLREDILTAY